MNSTRKKKKKKKKEQKKGAGTFAGSGTFSSSSCVSFEEVSRVPSELAYANPTIARCIHAACALAALPFYVADPTTAPESPEQKGRYATNSPQIGLGGSQK